MGIRKRVDVLKLSREFMREFLLNALQNLCIYVLKLMFIEMMKMLSVT